MDYAIDELLEEEIKIIEVFSYEMNEYGHKGYYSFYDNIPNGYSIYKEDGSWICDFNEKGKTISTKKYTNIYNLCMDILFSLQIDAFYYARTDLKIPRGTRVIITKSNDCPIDELRKGVIINSKLERDGAKSKIVYQVLGDDNEEYTGLYGINHYNEIYFQTMEDYIESIKEQIVDNTATIKELHDLNWSLYLNLNEITSEKDKYLENNGNIKIK